MGLMAGDVVKLHPMLQQRPADEHREFVIERMLRTNAEIRDLATGGLLRCKPDGLVFLRKQTYAEAVAKIEQAPRLTVGQVVTVKRRPQSARWRYPMEQRFVVIAVKDRVNVTKLGGENGLYWRLPADMLEVCDV